jgi:hypothetical protein
MRWERRLLSALTGPPRRRRLVILSFHRVLEIPDPLLPSEPSHGTSGVYST